jgi:Holliday junction resolvase
MNSRRKGAGGEREVCEILNAELGWAVKRNLAQTRDGGFDIEIAQFRIEVKRRKKLMVHEFMEQAEKSAGENHLPVVLMRADGEEWLLMMKLSDALPLIRDALPQR